ncbi:hypothetical protein HN958_04250 [Candidatus Falkowbacteria bacterium]|nr:hypothetical protein [Candidatus Falkowbacteria bacterium]MBT7007688.1 hypothetical protein [Candidatus Falkowbacteria bacterium]
MRKFQFRNFLIVAVVIATALFISGCTRYEEGKQDNEPTTAGDWIAYTANDFEFNYPDGWFVELAQRHGENDELIYSLLVKNTDKEVVLGGSAPDDYYIEVSGKSEINSQKYTNYYALINVNVTQSSEGWDDFFAKYYPDSVTGFETVDLSFLTDNETVQATSHNAVYLGDPRYFIRSGEFVYDIALHVNGVDEGQAQEVFKDFIQNFSF